MQLAACWSCVHRPAQPLRSAHAPCFMLRDHVRPENHDAASPAAKSSGSHGERMQRKRPELTELSGELKAKKSKRHSRRRLSKRP